MSRLSIFFRREDTLNRLPALPDLEKNMAKLIGVFNASHTPFCFAPPEAWDDMRAARQLRADVPLDDLEANRSKSKRLTAALDTLRGLIAAANPDVVVTFASDQLEAFDFRNFPRLAVYVGDSFEGRSSSTNLPGGTGGGARTRVPGHPEFATKVLQGLIDRGFDPAFCVDMPKPSRGLAHGLIWKAESMTGVTTPTVPVLLNCHYAPQITGRRSFQIGRALRAVIDEDESDLRVAVVGTGGLWHTPGARDAYLDEDFDREMLARLQAGDVEAMAAHFDAYEAPPDDASQSVSGAGRDVTGMPLAPGPQGGTRQYCNWIAAAGVAHGTPWTILDYVPVYASPIGAGFAYTLLK
jgi:hypothetical protein